MRRTKEWWAQLEPGERQELVHLEGGARYSGTFNGCWLCGACGECSASAQSNLCLSCSKRLMELIDKAEKGAGK